MQKTQIVCASGMATWESNPSGPGAHQAGAAHADPVDVEVEVARQTKRAVAGTPLRDSRYAAILLFVYVVVCFILMGELPLPNSSE